MAEQMNAGSQGWKCVAVAIECGLCHWKKDLLVIAHFPFVIFHLKGAPKGHGVSTTTR